MKTNDWVYSYETEIELFKNFSLPVRSTVLKLNNGDGVIISPIEFSEADWAEIKSNVSVKHIVAPCDLHHLYVKPAKKNAKEAKLWATHDLARKRIDVNWDQELMPQKWTLSDEIEIIPIDGADTHEVVFFHKKAKTLVVTDLLFNLHNRKGILSWVFLHLFGTWNRPAVSRWFKTTIKNKNQFRMSMEKVLSLDFETIMMAHGNIITENAKSVFSNALAERKLINF